MPSDPSSQPTQPLTDEQRFELWRAFAGGNSVQYFSGFQDQHWTAGVDRLAVALAPMLDGEYERLRVENTRLRAENTALAAGVLGEIVAERAAQFAKFGEQNHVDGTGPYVKNPDRMSNMEDQSAVARLDCQEAAKAGRLNWMLILREEVYEAFAEEDPDALRTELVQVAAVAATWVEAIDRRALGLDQDGRGQDA